MSPFEITELGQIREQENMLERARRQALRRAHAHVQPGTGRLSQPRRALRHFVALRS